MKVIASTFLAVTLIATLCGVAAVAGAAPPGDVTGLTLSQAADVTTLSWTPPTDPGCDTQPLTFDLLRSPVPDNFESELRCVEIAGSDTTATDLNVPLPGKTSYYLVRATSCETGSAGTASSGSPRVVGSFAAVTNLADSGPGSLRQAIADAAPGALICVPKQGALRIETARFLILDAVSIRGAGRDLLEIDGDGIHGVFGIAAETVLSDMTITNASAAGPAVEVVPPGSVSLDTVRVSENLGRGIELVGGTNGIVDGEIDTNGGGGIFAIGGTVDIADSTIDDNQNDGMWVSGSEVTIESSVVSNNVGDGVHLWGPGGLDVRSSAIYDNGFNGVFSEGPQVVITTTTISGHSQNGVNSYYAAAELRSSTVGGNFIGVATYGGSISLRNTVLDNTLLDCDTVRTGAIISRGYNLAADMTCGLAGAGDRNGEDPLLGPLTDNGGPTPTRLPGTGSPVLDAGSCPAEPLDQRGVPRPIDLPGISNVDDGCDIGAVETTP